MLRLTELLQEAARDFLVTGRSEGTKANLGKMGELPRRRLVGTHMLVAGGRMLSNAP
jgi:hypothetical protein